MSQEKSMVQRSNNNRWQADKETRPRTQMKRMTIDISSELHQKIKLKSVLMGKSMVEMIRTILEKEFS